MKRLSRICLGTALAIASSACGGGNGKLLTAPQNFDFQAGIADMVARGFTVNVALSGTVIVNGTTSPFNGSGTYSLPPAVTGTFNGAAALAQTQTVAGTITEAGQSSPFSASVTDYYATGDSALLGEDDGNEYDVAQAPFTYPTMIVGGSAGILGTLSRYTDSTMSVSLGTAQVSYAVLAPVDPGGPVGITLTESIYDGQNTLAETDVTHYTMTSSNVISFVSASSQSQRGTLAVAAQ